MLGEFRGASVRLTIQRPGQLRSSVSAFLALAAAFVLLAGAAFLIGAGFFFKPSVAKGKTHSGHVESSSPEQSSSENETYIAASTSSSASASAKSSSASRSLDSSRASSSSSVSTPSSSQSLPALPRDPAAYAEIDRHSLAATTEAETNLESLAAYLVKPARTDDEKARAIYRWITDRISYDVETFLAHKPHETRPDAILKSRKCVCDGYSNLFQRLCKEAGLEAKVVDGVAKGIGFAEGSGSKQDNHAWNVVKLGGSWYLVDATWGAGRVNGDKFQKAFASWFFLSPPDAFIFTHYPREPQWSLLPSPPTRNEFEKLPKVDDVLFEYGVTGAALRKAMEGKSFQGFVQGLSLPDANRVTLKDIPLDKTLAAGVKQHFRIECADTKAAAFISDGKVQLLSKNGNIFEGDFVPKKGTLMLGIKARDGNRFNGIVEYVVE